MKLEQAIAAFDRANDEDPNRVLMGGVSLGKELAYARRLSAWVERLAPQASEALRLAARCQHLRRWEIPRANYPTGRRGYLRWRSDLAAFHAERSTEILKEIGYDEALRERVKELNLKRGLGRDPEVQILEDALCLVFLENQLAAFASEHDRPTVVRVLTKTWRKMGPAGRTAALSLPLPADLVEILREAGVEEPPTS